MKASGNIEFWVKIDDEELKRLETESIDGKLKFFEDHHEKIKREIPLVIKRNMNDGYCITVDSIPEDKYIGYASMITVNLGEYNYQDLKEGGYTMDRYGGGIGKVYIEVVHK